MSLIAYTVKVARIFKRLDLKYALVGGLVCILMSIRRITEDADFIVEVKSFSDLEKFFWIERRWLRCEFRRSKRCICK